MEFIPVQYVAQVQMIYLWDNQQVENVFNYEFTHSPASDEMVALAENLAGWWDTNMKVNATSNFSLIKVIVKDLTTQFSPGIEYGIGLPLAGTGTDVLMPNNVTLAVKWVTGLRGRSYRGRTYHMPIKRAWVDGSRVYDGPIASLISFYTLLLDMSALDDQPAMVVVSRFSGGLPRSAGVTTPITGVAIDPTLDSQRRRLPGRGQ